MKKLLRPILLSICLSVALLFAAACTDTFGRPDDYVEVERLTVEKADVYLSPSGETSTYAVKVNILPENATNRKLDYYVPSEYLQYVRVSSDGVVSATGQATPEGVVIPVKISSTTNKSAYVTVNVVVEYVAVKEIDFAPNKVTVLYNGEGFQANPVFSPSHAQDGRAVSYRSLNEEIATVTSTGFVQPIKAGHTYILCEGTTSAGKTVTGRLAVEVVYNAGRYKLEVSDSNPQYNQVLGEFKAINFNLMSLDPHSDPDIRIQWYVDSKRVTDIGLAARQYEHTPNVESRTSYRIKVVIDSNFDAQQVLYSELITIYGRFNGFDLDYENLKTNLSYSYRYGDEATFVLTEGQSSVVAYNWYLKKKKDLLDGVYVGTTFAADRNFTARLNVEGDFTLTAKGVDSEGRTATTKDFDFSVTRFVAGDTLVINPVLLDYGTPPETYNYFIVRCDENGLPESDSVAIGHSSEGEAFNYQINAPGYYILTANATLNGTVATVKKTVDGKETEVEFSYTSDVIKVYSANIADATHDNDLLKEKTKFSAVNERLVKDVVISGIYDGEYKAMLSWDAPLGVEDYTVEIKKGDEVTIINNGAGFGNNCFVIPSEIAGLNDRFSVRVKADGGLFSYPYYYNMPAIEGYEQYYYGKIAQDKYSYLKPVDGTTTRYLRNMDELGRLLRFVTGYTPSNIDEISYHTESIDGVMTGIIRFNIYADFDLGDARNYYDGGIPEGLDEEYIGIYGAMVGAQNVYCTAGVYGYSFAKTNDGGYEITVTSAIFGSAPSVPSEKSGIVSANYSLNPYGNKDVHEIDNRQPKSVSNSEQLFFAVANGFRPSFASDGVRILYNKALNVVNSVIGEGMSDYEKALAFFDYLTINVKYDSELAALANNGDASYYEGAGYKLEGVFDYGLAVCDGISKAYVLLCAIEGIRCERITGKTDGAAHAWNKVCIDGKYYVVDCTNGAFRQDGASAGYPDYGYFMLSDDDYKNLWYSVTEYGKNPVCDGRVVYYDGSINGCALTVRTAEELESIINSYGVLATTVLSIRFEGELTAENIKTVISSLSTVNGIQSVTLLDDERAAIVLLSAIRKF